MELHSPVVTKKLWNYLRIAFFMLRKGLISKTKLFMDMNLKLQRGKLAGKNLANLMFHHHHPVNSTPLGFYEFSCSNTPNPIFLHTSKRRSIHFPCLHATPTNELSGPLDPIRIIQALGAEYSPKLSAPAAGEKRSPFGSPLSNYSAEEEGEEPGSSFVDVDAEEFIKKFYEQLKVQSPGTVGGST